MNGRITWELYVEAWHVGNDLACMISRSQEYVFRPPYGNTPYYSAEIFVCCYWVKVDGKNWKVCSNEAMTKSELCRLCIAIKSGNTRLVNIDLTGI